MVTRDISQNNETYKSFVQPVDSLIDLPTVRKQIHKGKSWIYKEIALGKFPAAIKLGRSSLWSQNSINEYIENAKANSSEL